MENSLNEKINIKYTEGAMKEMPDVYNKFKKNLENYVYNKKYVLGDDVLEVTASDIKKALQDIEFIDRGRNLEKSYYSVLVVKLYIFVGVVLIFSSFFYDSVYEIFITQPQRALFLIAGFMMIFLGFALNQIVYKKISGGRNFFVERDIEKEKLRVMINDLILQIESLQSQVREK